MILVDPRGDTVVACRPCWKSGLSVPAAARHGDSGMCKLRRATV